MDLLDRVNGHDADNRGAGFLGFGEHLLQNAVLDERTHGVVYRHQLGGRVQRRQGVFHGFLPAVSTFHQAHQVAEIFGAKQFAQFG